MKNQKKNQVKAQKKKPLSTRVPERLKKSIRELAEDFEKSITEIVLQMLINGYLPTKKQLIAIKKIFTEGTK